MPGFIRHLAETGPSYNISRSYNTGKWIKLQVILGFTCVFAFLTVFSLATNGFDKQLRYTTDPNATESQKHWYNNKFFTWGDDRLDPKCQNNEIPVGHEFITTNRGLRYTVRRVLYFPPGSRVAEERSSVSYHNNVLRNCNINMIHLAMRKVNNVRPARRYLWWGWLDSTAEAVARCDIINDDGFFTLEFSVKYNNVADDDYSYMALNNATSHGSFWWGSRLLNAYFVGTKFLMSYPVPNTDVAYTRAGMNFWITNTSSMQDFDLFRTQYFFLDTGGGVTDSFNSVPESGGLFNNLDFAQSRPLTEGFFFAKVFRSLMLVDLGNSGLPNLLLDEELLQYALHPEGDDFNRIPGAPLLNTTQVDWFKFNGIPLPTETNLLAETAVQMNLSFTRFRNQTGPLKTENASIYAEYICSVPEMKPVSAVVLFTLVATLAVFQSAWTVFKWVLDGSVTWKDRTANWCEGCIAHSRELGRMGEGKFGKVQGQMVGCRGTDESSSLRGLKKGGNETV